MTPDRRFVINLGFLLINISFTKKQRSNSSSAISTKTTTLVSNTTTSPRTTVLAPRPALRSTNTTTITTPPTVPAPTSAPRPTPRSIPLLVNTVPHIPVPPDTLSQVPQWHTHLAYKEAWALGEHLFEQQMLDELQPPTQIQQQLTQHQMDLYQEYTQCGQGKNF